jgi:hypothetical protein
MAVQPMQWIADYFLLFFALLWIAISLILSNIGGWNGLANHYRNDRDRTGETFRFRSGSFRYGISYNNCLSVNVSKEGLGLSVLFLFRIGHPPLFIPWRDISISRGEKFFMKIVKFHFRKTPLISLCLKEGLADKIKEIAGHQWKEDKI